VIDQRGRLRVFDFPAIANSVGGDGSDVGAFELQPLQISLGLPQKNGLDMTLSFKAEAAQRYRVEATDIIDSPLWSPVGNDISGSDSTVTVTDVGGAAHAIRFYRAQALQ
jgi:hypothetical protein